MSARWNRTLLPGIAVLLMLLVGCAGGQPEVKVDEMEKWNKLAETSKGHSPSPVKREISVVNEVDIAVAAKVIAPSKRDTTISDFRQQAESESIIRVEKQLPKMRISLKMNNADVKAILRAMALSVGLNILVKDDIKKTTLIDESNTKTSKELIDLDRNTNPILNTYALKEDSNSKENILKGNSKTTMLTVDYLTVNFRAVPWDEVFKSILKSYGLDYVWEGDVLRVLSTEDKKQMLEADTVKRKQKAEELLIKADEPLSTVVIAIDYANAEDLKTNLQEFLPKDKDGKPGRASVRFDKHSNSLIIQATREDIERMIPLIERIDKPTPQIHIRANIVETSKQVARDLGIQWGSSMKNRGGKGELTMSGVAPNSGTATAANSAGLSTQGFGISFPVSATALSTAGGSGALGLMFNTLSGDFLEMQLQALQSDGKINIISSPSITTVDNQEAYVSSGEKVPYVSTSSTGTEVKFVDAVLKLTIKPHVIDGKNLKMDILVNKDEVDSTRAVQGNPYIVKKETRTTLIVQHGETIVISGMTRQKKNNSSSGLPGLKDIPVAGALFRNDSSSDNMEEVLIFITPQILPVRPYEAANADMKPKAVQEK